MPCKNIAKAMLNITFVYRVGSGIRLYTNTLVGFFFKKKSSLSDGVLSDIIIQSEARIFFHLYAGTC